MNYLLSQAGRELVELDGNRAECVAQVKAIAKGELIRCRARYGEGYMHGSDGCYSITLAPDKRSMLWTSVGLVECR